MTITLLSQNEQEQLYGVFPKDILQSSDVCVGAVEDDEVVGVLTAKAVLAQTWDITYIYVNDQNRRQGVARDMLRLFCIVIRRMGAGAITMSFVKELKDPLYLLAEECGFETVSSSAVTGTRLSDVRESLERYTKKKPYVVKYKPIGKVTKEQWKQFEESLLENRESGLEEGMLFMPLRHKNTYNQEVSMMAFGDEKEPVAAILISEGKNFFVVDYLVCIYPGESALVVHLLKEACAAAETKYEERGICFHSCNEISGKVANSLLGKKAREVGRAVYMIKYLWEGITLIIIIIMDVLM